MKTNNNAQYEYINIVPISQAGDVIPLMEHTFNS